MSNHEPSNHEPPLSPSQIVPAVARDTSRRDWLRHTSLLVAGAAATAALTGSRLAQAQPADTLEVPPRSDQEAAGERNVPAPDAPQSVAGASVVADVKANPNNPANTIPAAGKGATTGDVDILNFALGLEYLEADFYSRVVAAHQARPYLSPRVFQIAQTLANDETAHVTAILEILNGKGATPIAKPEFQFPVNTFISPLAFLDLAAQLEVTGTGAYLGAAPMVKNLDVLKFAASVYGIEARHTGLIRFVGGMSFSPQDTETPLTMAEVNERVKPFIRS